MTAALKMLAKECALAEKQVAAMKQAIAALKGTKAKRGKPAPHTKGAKKAKVSHISPEGLKRIRLAQKARWQKWHGQQAKGKGA